MNWQTSGGVKNWPLFLRLSGEVRRSYWDCRSRE